MAETIEALREVEVRFGVARLLHEGAAERFDGEIDFPRGVASASLVKPVGGGPVGNPRAGGELQGFVREFRGRINGLRFEFEKPLAAGGLAQSLFVANGHAVVMGQKAQLLEGPGATAPDRPRQPPEALLDFMSGNTRSEEL